MTVLPPSETDPAVNWLEVADSIANGEAVLVLGPDAIPLYRAKGTTPQATAGAEPAIMSFSQLSRRKVIQSRKDLSIAYYYERDNLFLFENAESKRNALKIVREAAHDKTWLPDEELMRQIAAIPFCLVLDINPDTYLYDAFIQYGLTPQFDYFSSKDKPSQPNITEMSGNRPLLYNLCGSVEKLDSLILDYNDLFDLLRNMLGDLGVPQALRHKLQEADRFVLIGLQLERWYFQLFLHYLNKLNTTPFDNPTKNFSILSEVEGDTREFVLKQFNLECIAPSRAAFDELYAACEQRGILRQLANPLSATAADIQIRVRQNDFEGAFALLEKHAQRIDPTELALLKSRYNDWWRKSNEKRENSDNLDVEINKIRYTLLTYASQIPDENG